jgi:GH15 family glucan-1,4-alpha-glucosidase
MEGHPYPPIADYAFISNCQSAALISREGSVDWCCFQRFDARPCFSRLLDWRRGGHFRISPADEYQATRRYLPGTNILETTFRCVSGVLVLIDLLPIASGRDASAPHPRSELIRLARCEAGEVQVKVEFEPRFDYGLTSPRLDLSNDQLGIVYGGADALVVQCDLGLSRTGLGGCATVAVLQAGDGAAAVVSHSPPHLLQPRRLAASTIQKRLRETQRFWEEWSGRCTYRGPYREAVVRSALVLKGLTDAATGAIVAAPTTSLPESVGGVRNWDYRCVWLRDAALNLYALFGLGYRDEAHRFMNWIKRTTAGQAADLQVLYGVGGERMLPEQELRHLEGYRGSLPVRIGNAAVDQFQLDIYGELMDTAWLYHKHGGEIGPDFWDLLRAVVDVVERRWQEPDESVWEFRDARRHFVISKVMCWVAVQRAIRLARALKVEADVEHWTALRDEIRRRVESEGVDRQSGSFVQAFGSSDLDAANLLIPLVRFLPADDPRVRATLARTQRHLCSDGLVSRYLRPDGLPGDEGAFLICSFWLVDNLAMCGEVDQARKLFERICGYSNDLGLMAEQFDTRSGEQLGNFPQAFSHVGLIGAALNLEKAAAQRAQKAQQ